MSGTAVEHVEAQDLEARKHLNRVLVTADQLAGATMVLRSDLRNKVQDVRAIALTLDQHGLPITIQNVNACFVVNGAVEFMTRLWTGLAMARGHHRVWVCDADGDKCGWIVDPGDPEGKRLISKCRAPSSATEGRAHIQRGDDGLTYTATFSWEQAKTAGLTESATYKKYPQDMLGWRALSRAVKRYAPDIVIGVGEAVSDTVPVARPRPPAFDPMPAQDEDVVDGEIVEPGEDPGVTPAQMSEGVERSGETRPAPQSETPSGHSDSDDEELAAFIRWKRAGKPRDENGAIVDVPAEAVTVEPDPETAAVNADASIRAEDRIRAGNTAAAPLPRRATGGVDWRHLARQHDVTVGGLLIQARKCAEARGLPAPESIEDVTDEQLEADLVDWLGPA